MSGPVLSVQNVTKTFGGVTAINGVSLEAQKAEILGLVGPNGAGKSTLISLISGFMPPDTGSILLNGEDVTAVGPSARARRGLIRTFQAATPLRGLTVKQNVQVGLNMRYRSGVLRVLARTGKVRREEVELAGEAESLLERCGLNSDADRLATELPFGKLRMLEIARAIAAEPKLLLLDEPGAGLNHFELEQLSALLSGIRAEGATVLLVDHDVSFLFALCDHVALLDFGQLLIAGPAAEVRESDALRDAYLGSAIHDGKEASR